MTATNIGNYCRSPYGLYDYCSALAIDGLGIECRHLGKVIQGLGIECYNKRYDTGNLRILWEIGSDGIEANNMTASSSVGVEKGVLNLKSDIIEQYWQTVGASDEWFTVDVGSGKTIAIDTLALIGTNLTTSAIIKLKGYGGSSSSPPADWDQVPFINLNGIDNALNNPQDRTEENRIWISPTLPQNAFRYYKVSFVDSTNPDGFIKIGRFVAGASLLILEENCLDSITYKNENYKDEFSINGFSSIANNRAMKKHLTISFKDLNLKGTIDNYKNIKEYVRYCRDTLKALVIVDPADPYRFHTYAKLTSMPEETHRYVSSDAHYAEFTLVYNEGR